MKKILLVLKRAALCKRARHSKRRNAPECPEVLRVRGHVIITSDRGLDGKRREGRVILTNTEFENLLRRGHEFLPRRQKKRRASSRA